MRIIKYIKKYVFFKLVKLGTKKVLGISLIEEKIRTLNYFLNSFAKPSDLSHAKGDLRLLELCDTQMLRIFDEATKKLGLTYWLIKKI